MTNVQLVETPHGPTLIIQVDDQRAHVLNAETIASWGELLGLDDEEALAAIIMQPELPKQSDDPDDNGWTALYDQLREVAVTEVQVETVKRQYRLGVSPTTIERANLETNVPPVAPEMRATIDRFGADLTLAQTEAVQENIQRTARSAIGIDKGRIPRIAREIVRGTLAPRVQGARSEFRGSIIPGKE